MFSKSSLCIVKSSSEIFFFSKSSNIKNSFLELFLLLMSLIMSFMKPTNSTLSSLKSCLNSFLTYSLSFQFLLKDPPISKVSKNPISIPVLVFLEVTDSLIEVLIIDF